MASPESRSHQNKVLNRRLSQSFKHPSPTNFGLEDIDSPRFQEILQVTNPSSVTCDCETIPLEFGYKKVHSFPISKSRSPVTKEEVVGMVKEKFNQTKDEISSELEILIRDYGSMLEKTTESHEWRKCLEELSIIAQQCAKMPAEEFWFKCESIVQDLADRRQKLPMGALKQAHTRLLFILSRCTRLVQVLKEENKSNFTFKLH